jgi:hypothetical protein
MSTYKKIQKTIAVSSNLKLHYYTDGSFEVFFRGSPGGYYFVFSPNNQLMYRVHKSAYGIGKPEKNIQKNWNDFKDLLNREDRRQKLPGVLKKFLVWEFEPKNNRRYVEERLGCIIYFREKT